jgi:replicative DNA helicase
MAEFPNTRRATARRPAASLVDTALEAGKLPPQAPELEQAVLGALMLERNAVNEAIDILQPESFYVDAHQRSSMPSWACSATTSPSISLR